MCRKEIDFTTCDLCCIINWLVPVGVFWDWIFVLIVEGSRWEEKVLSSGVIAGQQELLVREGI